MNTNEKSAFEAAGAEKESTLVGEFIGLMKANKKYWLAPLVVIMLLFGLLIILGSTAAAPFIYTLF
ncbi:MAG TPA: DUF5989 family protein [Chthoniobacterales bacterium]|nr:DUF5989 family protein [Chthoniobacterales bacterium]